jgi:hypothetical protein
MWLALGQQLPQAVSLGSLPDNLFFPTWQWQINKTI